jgi:UDP-N-acetyl-D-mannosaminuronate dehydrogenase
MYLWNDPQATIVRAARAANRAMPNYAVELLEEKGGSVAGKKVAVLGAAYRGGVKETAFSGVFDVVESLTAHGALAVVHDPMYTDEELTKLGFTPYHLGEAADAVIVQADHSEYRSLSVTDIPGARTLIDGRRVINPELAELIPTFVLGSASV